MVKKPMSRMSGTTQMPTMPTASSVTPAASLAVATGASDAGSMAAPATMHATRTAVATAVNSSIGQPLLTRTVFSTDAAPSATASGEVVAMDEVFCTDMMVPFSLPISI